MDLFLNIFFCIFMLFFSIYIILKSRLNVLEIKDYDSLNDFLQKLHKYRIKNIYYNIFILLFYFSITIALLCYFRYTFLGTHINIFLVNYNKTFIIQWISLMLCIIFYLKIIYLDFFSFIYISFAFFTCIIIVMYTFI